MRLLWLIALCACGEADTIELDLLRDAPPKPKSDAGVTTPADAGTGKAASADIFPGTLEFGWVAVGGHSDRELSAVNRNDETIRVRVLVQPESFFVLTPTDFEMGPNSRTFMDLRVRPNEAGTHDRAFEIDACDDGCVVRVRVVGIAE